MNLLEASQLRFEQAKGGALSLMISGRDSFVSVECVPLFPLSDPGRFVSVCERTGAALREIGIIDNLAALDPLQKELVEADIRFRYFVPEITDILKISSKRGIDTWEVMTDRGKKTFMIQDRNENVSITDGGTVFAVGVDSCRYKIQNYRSLPGKARAQLERVLL
jgi:hypothetical protein